LLKTSKRITKKPRRPVPIVEELNEAAYGEFQYGVEDLDGHHWLFARHARDVNPEDWGAKLAE
jgi:hypothetical protein